MAELLQTITPPPTITLFSGLPRGSNNIYPRARVLFSDRTAIASKLTANTNTVQYILNLPENFAYRLDQAHTAMFSTTTTDSANFADLGQMNFRLITGVPTVGATLRSEGDSNFADVGGGFKSWSILDPFTEVFYQVAGGEPSLQVQLFDNTSGSATGAQSTILHWSFLQYDIEQVINVGVNAPQPVFSV